MDIIEQFWERKNLDVNSVEFRINGSDSIDELGAEVLNNTDYDYQICRVPVGRMDIAYLLQKNGFSFCETNFELSANLNNLILPKVYESYANVMNYHLANEAEMEQIYNCIYSGVFDTDKISLDPFFEKSKSGIRFANWAKQEIAAGKASSYIVTMDEKAIGFFILKNVSDKVDYSLLAALFNKSDGLGFGFSTIYFPMLQAKVNNRRRIITGVSSNNPTSVRTHLSLGYEIKSMNYVFVKHI